MELAQQEFEEIEIIENLQLDLNEIEQIVKKIILEINANSLRDMGKVMSLLKENYSGKMDFGKAGVVAKNCFLNKFYLIKFLLILLLYLKLLFISPTYQFYPFIFF